jgi:hypothetical protein
MGMNLYARCTHAVAPVGCHGPGEVAFVYRKHEAEAISEWYHRHPNCEVVWAVDNTNTSPGWVDAPSREPIELPMRVAEKNK